MVVMGVIGNNAVTKFGSNGINVSNHEVIKLKLIHVIMKKSIVVLSSW
jgi:hypothetical protein